MAGIVGFGLSIFHFASAADTLVFLLCAARAGVESFLPLAAAYTKNEGLLFTVFLDVLFLVGKNKQLKAATIYTLVFAGCSVGQFYWSKKHFELAFSKTAGLHHLGDVKGCAAMELYSL